MICENASGSGSLNEVGKIRCVEDSKVESMKLAKHIQRHKGSNNLKSNVPTKLFEESVRRCEVNRNESEASVDLGKISLKAAEMGYKN